MEPLETNPPVAGTAPAAGTPLWSRAKAALIETVQTVLLAGLFYAIVSVTTARVVVDGPSMRPTLNSGEWVVVNRLAYRLGSPQRGDVVVILPPTSGQADDLIKRVIGLPGQTVEVRDGGVYIDGGRIDEPYAKGRTYPAGVWTLGADELFLMGDNREVSLDSRSFGPILLEMVVGKAEMIYWPPEEWGPLSWRVPTPKNEGMPATAGPTLTPVVGGGYPEPGFTGTVPVPNAEATTQEAGYPPS